MGNKIQKIYITGVAGTGKSSVIVELRKRSIEAFDIDNRDMCYWVDKNGNRAEYRTGIGKEWIAKHDYICDKEKLKKLIESAKDNLIFISGISDNQNEYIEWFDNVFLLQCESNQLLNRLKNRDTNDFAKEESEQKFVLDMQNDFDEKALKNGAIPINSNSNVIRVTDKILAYLK
ncbi:MAG TPA: AAA family ATPase [Patescibacteria group bacterium]|nr:AAA family ATPase [Patescibacteria group bacterium]